MCNKIADKPFVSIVIPTYNRKEKLVRLIESIQVSEYKNLEIIVVDDISTDGTYDAIKNIFTNVKIIKNERELLLAGSRNVGIKNSLGDFIFFVDDDNVLDKYTISELVKFISKNKKIIASPLMLYYSAPSIVWCAGARTDKVLFSIHCLYHNKNIKDLDLPKTIDCEYNPNAYMMTRDIFEIVGNFNEKVFPISWEDNDFFRRAKIKGFFARTITSSKIWHDVHTSEYFHITNIRSYYRGKTRINFYLKYAKWRILLSILDVLYFVFFVLRSKTNIKDKESVILSYVKGMSDGFMSK